MTLAPGLGAHDVRPDRTGVRRDESRHDRRPRHALAKARCACRRAAGRPRARRRLRNGRSRDRRPEGRGGARDGPRLLGEDARTRAPEAHNSSGCRATCSRCRSRTGHSMLRPSASVYAMSPTWSWRCVSCGACCSPAARLAILEITPASRPAETVLLALVRSDRPAARASVLPGGGGVHLPAGVGEALPARRGSRRAARRLRLRRRAIPAARRVDRRAAHRSCANDRSSHRSMRHPALPATWQASRRGSRRRSPRARGSRRQWPAKRSRPAASGSAHCSASSRRGREPPVAAAVAVELVHMATLVHDDLVDGARLRRGLPAAWSVYGADAAKAAGDYLYACAFAVLAATRRRCSGRDARGRRRSASSRGEAMQKLQTHDPDTPVDGLPRALCAEDGEAVRGGVPARLERRRATRCVWARSRDRLPDRRRHPRLRR